MSKGRLVAKVKEKKSKPSNISLSLSGSDYNLKISGTLTDWNNFHKAYYSYEPAQRKINAENQHRDFRALVNQATWPGVSRARSKKTLSTSLCIYSALLYEIIKHIKRNDPKKYASFVAIYKKDIENDSSVQNLTRCMIESLFNEALRFYNRSISFTEAGEGFEKHYLTPGRKLIKSKVESVWKEFSRFKPDCYSFDQKHISYDLASDIWLSLVTPSPSPYFEHWTYKAALGKEKYLKDMKSVLLSAFPSLTRG